ncbi:hypothetical protein Leryth_013229 [Lithospermum erythrorhizon]|nr:hypothetical protein Leryth_013229 [Lithospermum erythrorhizon]
MKSIKDNENFMQVFSNLFVDLLSGVHFFKRKRKCQARSNEVDRIKGHLKQISLIEKNYVNKSNTDSILQCSPSQHSSPTT